MKKVFLYTLLLTGLFSCGKPPAKLKSSGFEQMSGTYTATLYIYQRDGTLTETYDTLYNQQFILEVDDEADLVKFDDINYGHHNRLTEQYANDSVVASWSTNYERGRVTLIKSRGIVKYQYFSGYLGHAEVRQITGEFIKQ